MRHELGRRLFLLGGLAIGAALPGTALAAPPDDLVLDLFGQTLETRHVEKATFTMGSNASDPNHDHDEEPAHPVTINHDFWIGKYPVTREQFAKFVTDTRYVTDAEKGNTGGMGWDGVQLVQKKTATWRNPGFTQTDEHPVVLVTFGDAQAFVGWASRKTGKHVRLPTEAEWELAARGGTSTPWYGGLTETDNTGIGWFKSGAGGTRPVGQKKANPFGIFDMSGDVFEWCHDIYRTYPEAPVSDPDITTPAAGDPEKRVLRGGSWFRDIKRARSAARFKGSPGTRTAEIGFRVVVTNEETLGGGVSNPGSDLAPASPVGVGGTAVPSPAPPSNGGVMAGDAGAGARMEQVPASEISWTVLLASPLAAASAAVAWMLLRRRRAPGVAIIAPVGVSARLGEDGFFVRAPRVPGARVRFEYTVDGARTTDDAPLVGDESYVYTGVVPEALRIVEILGVRASRTPAPALVSAPVLPVVAAAVLLDGPPSSQRQPPPSSHSKPPPPVPVRPRLETIDAELSVDEPDGETVPLVLPDMPDQATVPLTMPGAPVDKEGETKPLVMPPSSPTSSPAIPIDDAPVSVSRVLILDDQSEPILAAPPSPPSSRPSAPPSSRSVPPPPVPSSKKTLIPASPDLSGGADSSKEPFLGHPRAY